jgi:hypothetical protein
MEENCCYEYTPSPASSAHSPPPLAQTSSPRVAPQGPEQPGSVADNNTAPATSYRPTSRNNSTKSPDGRAATTIPPFQASTRAQMAGAQNSGSLAPESLHITPLRSHTAPVRPPPSGTHAPLPSTSACSKGHNGGGSGGGWGRAAPGSSLRTPRQFNDEGAGPSGTPVPYNNHRGHTIWGSDTIRTSHAPGAPATTVAAAGKPSAKQRGTLQQARRGTSGPALRQPAPMSPPRRHQVPPTRHSKRTPRQCLL